MFVSDAKREANRRNSLKSTGPRTAEGKDRSRMNAVKHGLTSSVVVAEDPATIQGRYDTLFWDLKPRNQLQSYYVDQMVILSLRIDRSDRIERRLRDGVSLRAMTSWDEDGKLEAERVGLGLASRPGVVVGELRRSPHGCDWLMDRWAMLARAAESGDGWDEGRTRLAFDLLGTPAELRIGHPGAKIDPEGRLLDDGADHAGVAREQIARLREDREVADWHDEAGRALAEADLTHEPTDELRLLHRYQSALHNRLRWLMARMKELPVEFRTIPEHLLPKRESQPGVGTRNVYQGGLQNEAKTEERSEAKSAEMAPTEMVVTSNLAEPEPETDQPAADPALPEAPLARKAPDSFEDEVRGDLLRWKPDLQSA